MSKSGLDYLRYRLEIAKECEADAVKIDVEELASALGEVDRIKDEVISEFIEFVKNDWKITQACVVTEIPTDTFRIGKYLADLLEMFEDEYKEQIKERD